MADLAEVFRSEVGGRWCPVTSHFLSDDGVLGFQHFTEYNPMPKRCSLDWSEHPLATRVTTITCAVPDANAATNPRTFRPNQTEE